MTWLEQAQTVTKQSRQKEYGHPAINFLRTALQWSVLWARDVTVWDVAMAMDLMKTAREVETHKEDNMVDKLGYISCIDAMIDWFVEFDRMEGLPMPSGEHEWLDGVTRANSVNYMRQMTVPQMWELTLRIQRRDAREAKAA